MKLRDHSPDISVAKSKYRISDEDFIHFKEEGLETPDVWLSSGIRGDRYLVSPSSPDDPLQKLYRFPNGVSVSNVLDWEVIIPVKITKK